MRLTYLAPLIVFVLIGLGLAVGLTLNPREIPSALIGKPVPDFSLPPVVEGGQGLSSADLRAGDGPSLVNVFASWCVPCRVEHPLIMALAREGIAPVHGLNYKDKPADVAKWLDQLGNPFARTGADRDGRVGIDWGVYGVPETFVVDGAGRIVCKHVGPLMQWDVDNKIRPLLDDLKAGRASSVKC
ncbi:DsbE family thiol:disulfide interchange protein [Ferrovibrio sp.]|uniref:DsbE family thiol:disulfide interchange protein n=1 Tax=Ferrovibrio sp. TaxID=1917215 RepID=UPI00311D583F